MKHTKERFVDYGIDSMMVRDWKEGDTFIIQEKKDIVNPKEIIIKSKNIILNDADVVCNYDDDTPKLTRSFSAKTYVIVGECGTEIVILNQCIYPICIEYDLFYDWEKYNTITDEKVSEKSAELIDLKSYLNNYIKFQKWFKESNPEKII